MHTYICRKNQQMKSRLQQIRKSRGMTQEQIGDMISRSAAFISRAESGKAMLTEAQTARIAAGLGVREAWLAGEDGEMTEKESTRDRRSIGERIYQIRREKKMSQAEFARLLGVSRNTISLVERRKVQVSQALIRAAVGKAGADEQWLRTGEKTSRAEEIIGWLQAHPEDRERVRNYLQREPGGCGAI